MTGKGWTYLAMGLAVTLMLAVFTASAKPEKDSTLKDTMSRLHKGDNAIRPTIDKGLQEDDPDWPAIQKLTKEYLQGAETAAKTKPPVGDKESWDKLMKQFVATAKQLDDAAKAKDKKNAQAAHEKLVQGCANCHKMHRPQ
jgi:hypothetical protein